MCQYLDGTFSDTRVCFAGPRGCWLSTACVACAHGKPGHMARSWVLAHPIGVYSAEGNSFSASYSRNIRECGVITIHPGRSEWFCSNNRRTRCEIEYTWDNATKSAVVNTKQCTSYVVSIRLLCSLQISKTYKTVLDYSNSNISTFLQYAAYSVYWMTFICDPLLMLFLRSVLLTDQSHFYNLITFFLWMEKCRGLQRTSPSGLSDLRAG